MSSTESLPEIISLQDLMDAALPGVWFRGQANAAWALVPGVLRPLATVGAELRDVLSLEVRINREFRRRAHQFLPRGPWESEVDLYVRAQHAGLPTRLLDWSENALAALFFAIEDLPATDGAFFVLRDTLARPVSTEESDVIDRLVGSLFGFEGPGNLYGGARSMLDASNPLPPMQLLPFVREGRMNQQSARFTFHHNVDDWTGFELKQYLVPAKAKRHLESELRRMNVTRMALFPDLDNLARDLGRQMHRAATEVAADPAARWLDRREPELGAEVLDFPWSLS